MTVGIAGNTEATGEATAGVTIPFNRPSIEGDEIELIRAAVEAGHMSCSGPLSAAAAELLRESIGAQDVLLTTSCTAALEMSALLLDLKPGDAVVVPSFGFVTTALAYARQGARILFCDIEDRTLGIDPEHLAKLMDDSVRAVVPIHYSGISCDVEGITAVLGRWPRAELIEDNAHGLFGRFRDRPLGSFGRFASLSFHETKNFICGEGGALIVNDAADIDRAHVLYDKGTNRRAFLHGQVDKYSWIDTGSSFGLGEVLAAFLYGQLQQRDAILAKRRGVFERYQQLLEPAAERYGYRLPIVPAECEQAYHMFYVLLPDTETRNQVLGTLARRGVQATFHYVPLHSSAAGERFAARPSECPVTDSISGRLLRLPFFTSMTPADTECVAREFLSALAGRGARDDGAARP
jgi:dTDP-4-amino-4,6-dideoxygalactose transaminase